MIAVRSKQTKLETCLIVVFVKNNSDCQGVKTAFIKGILVTKTEVLQIIRSVIGTSSKEINYSLRS